jgi:hypothetical protein
MQIMVNAKLIQVQAKPPKEVGDDPTMKLVFEVEDVRQIGNLSRFLGQSMIVNVESYQLQLPEMEVSNETRIAQTR